MKKMISALALGTLVAIASAQLTGQKTISANGGDYPNITDAIAALNTDGVGAGGVTFIVKDDEVFTVPGTDASRWIETPTSSETNPVVFVRSNTGTAKPVFNFIGAPGDASTGLGIWASDYITFDGLVFNCDALISSAFNIQGESANGATHNTIKNCEMTLKKTGSSGIFQTTPTATPPTVPEAANSYNVYSGNKITDASLGIYFNNTTAAATNYDVGNIVSNNVITNFADFGIYSSKQIGAEIINNTISGYNNPTTTAYIETAIFALGAYSNMKVNNNKISGLTGNNSSVSGIFITGGPTVAGPAATYEVSGNQITDLNNGAATFVSGTSTYYTNTYGIVMAAAYSTANINNNLIANLNDTECASNSAVRAFSISGTLCNVNLYHNTVKLATNSTVAGNGSSASYISSGINGINMANNLFVNTSTNSLPVSVWYQGSDAAPAKILDADNNDYYAPVIYLGASATAKIIQKLADYKTFMGTREQNTITENPVFALENTTDYRLSTQLSAFGKVLTPAITKDINGFDRSATTPTIGAFEYGSPSDIKTEPVARTLDMISNYPNPFNPETTINFNLKADVSVKVTVYNAKGQLVSQLLNSNLTAGKHSVKFNALNLNSGVYFCRVNAGSEVMNTKMVLTK